MFEGTPRYEGMSNHLDGLEFEVHSSAYVSVQASFSTWCAMETDYQTELREAALAHKVQNMVIEAYQRSDLLEKRRSLMEDGSARITP